MELKLKQREMGNMVCNGTVITNLVIVSDNAPCHSNIEDLLLERGYVGARMFGSYSPQLNPIESVWSTVRAKFEGLHAIRKNDMMAGVQQNDITNTEFRLRYIETDNY